MNCPKCNASLKDGAQFCHVCGFNMSSAPADQQPQQQQPQQQQPIPGQGFDINKIPTKVWIVAGIAFFGVICTFLPWVTVSMGYWGSVSANGLNSAFGVLAMLGFLAIAGDVLFWQALGLKEKVKDQILLFTSFGVAAFCLIDLIRFLSQSGGYARPGFGMILAILVSVALILINLKIIKLK